MKLIALLRQSISATTLFAVALSVLSGMSSAALAVWIGRQVTAIASVQFWQLIGAVALVAVAAVLDAVAKRLLLQHASRVVYDIRLRLAAQMLALPYARYERIGRTRLNAVLTEDVTLVQMALGTVPALSVGVVKAAACVVYLAWMAPLVTVLLAGVGGAVMLVQRMLQRRAQRYSRRWFRARDESFRHYRGLTEGARELALNARRRFAFFNDQLEPAIASSQSASTDARLAHQWTGTWGQASQFVIVLVLFAVFATGWVDAGLAAAYAVVVLYLGGALTSTLGALPALTDASTAVDHMHALGFSPELPVRAPDAAVAAPVDAREPFRIDLRDVAFEYERAGVIPPASDDIADRFALGPLNVTLHSGELVFLVGGNGSGKTTFMKLLVGLYAPTQGSICVNGALVGESIRESYRQLFSVVFADVFLFDHLHGLMDEPAGALPADLDARARGYLRKLHLDKKVSVHDGLLSSIDLSHGQRKRLALLVAYLEDRRVYVFDEWANSQDPEFRNVFYHELLPELKARGKLVIVISHDDQYFGVADRLIKLDLGRVVIDSASE